MDLGQAQRGCVFVACAFVVISLSACKTTGGGFGAAWGEPKHSNHGHSNSGHQKSGPPAHAPAHGYRAKHKYHYYPASEVYFDTQRGVYFYLSGRNWKMSVSLPGDLDIRLDHHVSIEMDTDKPYKHHKKHKKKYPPGRAKGKNKNKKKKKWEYD